MVALGVPIPIHGIHSFKRVARVMLPFVSHFPMSMIFLWQRWSRAKTEICEIL